MITDKDISEARIIIDMVGGNSIQWREVRDIISRIRAESADQAMKEAAENGIIFMQERLVPGVFTDIMLDEMRAAILGETVNEGKTDAEKLAVAVKALRWALEYIGDGFLPEEGTPDHDCEYTTSPDKGYCEFCENYWIARDALKEIQ